MIELSTWTKRLSKNISWSINRANPNNLFVVWSYIVIVLSQGICSCDHNHLHLPAILDSIVLKWWTFWNLTKILIVILYKRGRENSCFYLYILISYLMICCLYSYSYAFARKFRSKNLPGDSGEWILSQDLLQVLSWWMLHNSIKLCSPWRQFVLQTSFFPAFQGER